MTEAVIYEWLVKEGDSLKKGDAIMVAETDKSTQEIYATESGVIEKLLADVGDTVACGENIISLIADNEVKQEVVSKPVIAKPDTITKEQAPIAPKQKATVEKKQVEKSDRIKISPHAKKTAKEFGIEVFKLSPEQTGKRITLRDVINYKELKETSVPTKQAIAPHMSSNMFASLEINACADKMLALTQKLNDNGLDIGYIDIIIKASAIALKKHKEMNANSDEINIGVEVDTSSGVNHPVITGADRKTIGQIKAEVDAMTSGSATFAISNLGSFGIGRYVSGINKFDCSTLCVGCIKKRFLPDENDMPKLTSIINFTLIFDEVELDGFLAAKFMQRLKQYIQQPELMLLW
jgi:pyruvate dehydrogenase E2 component (dihydrolipoamide acetyltransferase)